MYISASDSAQSMLAKDTLMGEMNVIPQLDELRLAMAHTEKKLKIAHRQNNQLQEQLKVVEKEVARLEERIERKDSLIFNLEVEGQKQRADLEEQLLRAVEPRGEYLEAVAELKAKTAYVNTLREEVRQKEQTIWAKEARINDLLANLQAARDAAAAAAAQPSPARATRERSPSPASVPPPSPTRHRERSPSPASVPPAPEPTLVSPRVSRRSSLRHYSLVSSPALSPRVRARQQSISLSLSLPERVEQSYSSPRADPLHSPKQPPKLPLNLHAEWTKRERELRTRFETQRKEEKAKLEQTLKEQHEAALEMELQKQRQERENLKEELEKQYYAEMRQTTREWHKKTDQQREAFLERIQGLERQLISKENELVLALESAKPLDRCPTIKRYETTQSFLPVEETVFEVTVPGAVTSIRVPPAWRKEELTLHVSYPAETILIDSVSKKYTIERATSTPLVSERDRRSYQATLPSDMGRSPPPTSRFGRNLGNGYI